MEKLARVKSTIQQYDQAAGDCKNIFNKKTKGLMNFPMAGAPNDFDGRISYYIKARRIRTLTGDRLNDEK